MQPWKSTKMSMSTDHITTTFQNTTIHTYKIVHKLSESFQNSSLKYLSLSSQHFIQVRYASIEKALHSKRVMTGSKAGPAIVPDQP